MWSRRTRLLVTGGVLTILLLSTLLLESPEPTRTVDEIMKQPSDYLDQNIAVRGEVVDGSIDNSSMSFLLEGGESEILVSFQSASVSNGLDDNRTVYAEGILRLKDGTYYLESSIIKTSCPSKYEAES